ncbi:MAG: hypothetical protein ACI85I_002057 [Arenicella sp.]|jgi:hypothetical protein
MKVAGWGKKIKNGLSVIFSSTHSQIHTSSLFTPSPKICLRSKFIAKL